MPAFKLAVVNEAGLPDTEVLPFVAAADEWIGKWLAPCWPEVAGSTIRSAPAGATLADEAQIVLAPNTTLANLAWTLAGTL